jgi:recombination endonuclease VII
LIHQSQTSTSLRAKDRAKRARNLGFAAPKDDGTIEHSLWVLQAGMCSICGHPMRPGGKERDASCIDHCHESGIVRGLVCRECNSMLAMASDNPCILDAGAKYLRGNGSTDVPQPPLGRRSRRSPEQGTASESQERMIWET